MLLSQVGRDWYARHGAARDTRQAAVSQRHGCGEAHCQAQQVQVRASSVGQCRAHRGVAAQTNRLRVFEAQTDARVAGVPFGQAQILRALCTEIIARPFVKAWQSTAVSNFGHIFCLLQAICFQINTHKNHIISKSSSSAHHTGVSCAMPVSLQGKTTKSVSTSPCAFDLTCFSTEAFTGITLAKRGFTAHLSRRDLCTSAARLAACTRTQCRLANCCSCTYICLLKTWTETA